MSYVRVTMRVQIDGQTNQHGPMSHEESFTLGEDRDPAFVLGQFLKCVGALTEYFKAVIVTRFGKQITAE